MKMIRILVLILLLPSLAMARERPDWTQSKVVAASPIRCLNVKLIAVEVELIGVTDQYYLLFFKIEGSVISDIPSLMLERNKADDKATGAWFENGTWITRAELVEKYPQLCLAILSQGKPVLYQGVSI